MKQNSVYAREVGRGWIGEFRAVGSIGRVVDHRGGVEIFQSQAEAVAMAGLALSREIKSND